MCRPNLAHKQAQLGILSVAHRVTPRGKALTLRTLPKYGCTNKHSNLAKLLIPSRPAHTIYETGGNRADQIESESLTDTTTCVQTIETEPRLRENSQAQPTMTSLIRQLLKNMPVQRAEIQEIAIQSPIRTATGADDAYEDVRREKHTCVTEPHTLTAEQQKQLEEVMAEFPYTPETGPLNCTPIYQQRINVGTAQPQMRKQYPMSPYVLAEVEKEIQNLIERDIIEPIDFSPWRWPILWVKKKSGGGRICLDARGLNQITIRDAYPTLKVDTILQNLPKAKFISCLDT